MSNKKVTRSASWRIIYTNVVGLAFGDNDVRINFGFDMDLSQPGNDVLEEAIVVMSPRSAKMIAFTLTSVVQNFEATNGPIHIDPTKLQGIIQAIEAQHEENKKKQAEAKRQAEAK